MRFGFASVFLAAPLLASLASAQFTNAEGASVTYPDLADTFPVDKQDACIHKCSLQVASDVTTSCVQSTKKSAAQCLCTNAPEAAEMKACFAENCPPLADRCAAVISDNGSISTFQISPVITKNSTSGSGPTDPGDGQSNTSGGDAPSNTGGANGGNAPNNTGGDGGDSSAASIGYSAAFLLLSSGLAIVML